MILLSMISDIRDYFITCTDLDSTKLLNVYKVLQDPVTYSLDPVSVPQTISEDVLGVKTKQFSFYFTTVQECKTTDQELAIQTFLESIVDWIELQEENENYPTADGEEIVVVNTPDLFSKDPSLANGIYQILINYKYKE